MNKKMLIGSIVGLSLIVSGTAFAATYKTPAQSVSDLTQIPVEKLYEERTAGKTYGEIANDNGVLDQFKDEMLQNKFQIIDERVKEGKITQENADAFKKAMEERMTDCDGTPDPNKTKLGQQFGGGMKFGGGMGQGQGQGAGMGQGSGAGLGRGNNNSTSK